MVQLISAQHVSPACVKLTYDGSLRNNEDLRDKTLYTVPGYTILDVRIPLAQRAPYDSGTPDANGGSPTAVYLVLTTEATATTLSVGMTATGLATIVDYDGGTLTGFATASCLFFYRNEIEFWTMRGYRIEETFRELNHEGRARLTTEQPLNFSLAHMIGKLTELVSGGFTAKLDADIDGPIEPSYVATFSPAGFSLPPVSVPGIGSTIAFKDGKIPYHVDKLWGSADGSNTTFAASIQFHPFECVVIVAGGRTGAADNGIVDIVRWYAPNSGDDRILEMVAAPPLGATILAVYIPKKSLLKIGSEIIAYEESNLTSRTAVIYGRAQLMSTLQAHQDGDQIVDVWAASMIKRAQYNQLAFGASGRPLEYIGLDRGSPRSDNATLDDTGLRRMIFHTSFTMRGVVGTAQEAIRYIFPELWPYIIVGEDPRWPGCVVIWFNNSTPIGDRSWLTSPEVEPWETWLDHALYADGGAPTQLYETYLRDNVVDSEFYGDFFLNDENDDPVNYDYPVILGGANLQQLGTEAPELPPPLVTGTTINTTFMSYLNRPPALDKVLPIGCGVLLLSTDLL